MKKIFALFLVIVCLVSCFTGCTAAENVNHNLSQKADNFEVVRKITVYNARTDLIVMEMEGLMSLSNNSTSELVVTCKVGPDQYKKNYIYPILYPVNLLFYMFYQHPQLWFLVLYTYMQLKKVKQ